MISLGSVIDSFAKVCFAWPEVKGKVKTFRVILKIEKEDTFGGCPVALTWKEIQRLGDKPYFHLYRIVQY